MILRHTFGTRAAALAAAALLTLVSAAQPAGAMAGVTITVDSTADDETTTGNCTLREAILAANTNTPRDACPAGSAGLDTIIFDSGVNTIVTAGEPPITGPVVIDGSLTGQPKVKLQDGFPDTDTAFDFETGSQGSTLKGFKITGFNLAVYLGGSKGGVTLVNNWIGTSDGTTNAISNSKGIQADSPGNHIGVAGQPVNLVSGNAIGILAYNGSGTVIQNNWVGLDKDGTGAVFNSMGVYVYGSKTLIGGAMPGQGNVISGNSGQGILVTGHATSTKIQRNFIGLTADGSGGVTNAVGIEDDGAVGTAIGGSMPGSGNLIANSSSAAILVTDSGATSKTMVTISGNLIGVRSNGAPLPNGDGVRFDLATAPTKVKLAGNLIFDSINRGIYITDAFAPAFSSSTKNCITGNAAGLLSLASTNPFSLKSNWWGAADGPSGEYTGIGDSVTATGEDISKFLTAAPTSCLGWASHKYTPASGGFKNVSTKATKFSWSKVPTASDYMAVLGTGSSAGAVTGVFDGSDSAATSFTTVAPLGYGTYYWQVTVNTPDNIDWLGPVQRYDVTIVKGPRPGFVAKSQTVTLAWNDFPGRDHFMIQIYLGAGCVPGNEDNPAFQSNNLSEFIGFGTGGLRSWTVQPDNGPIMPCWDFTTQ